MRTKRFLLSGAVILITVGLLAGCSGGPSEEELKLAEMQQQLTNVEEMYGALTQARADLVTAKVRTEELEAITERQRTDEQKAELEEITARLPELEATATDIDAFQAALADLLTTGLNDFPQNEETLRALQIYSDEALINAAEHVDKAGKYKDALDLLSSAVGYYEVIGVPPYQPVVDRVAEYEDWRYVSRERFDGLKKNMTMDEARATVGVPYYGNIQEDKDRGVITWLYRHREGGAAALYFRLKTGKLYGWKWDAIKTKVAE